MFGRAKRGSAALNWLAKRPWALAWWSRSYNALRLAARPGHRRRIRASRRVLRTIRGFASTAGAYPRALSYLRKVDPLVFEEVVLSAVENAGAFVVRNRRYSGDGGSDGEIWVRGIGWVELQMKRYGTHVSREHVGAFVRNIERGRVEGGWFVHTGRTGAACYSELRGTRVLLVSGSRLLELLIDGRLPSSAQGAVRGNTDAWMQAYVNGGRLPERPLIGTGGR